MTVDAIWHGVVVGAARLTLAAVVARGGQALGRDVGLSLPLQRHNDVRDAVGNRGNLVATRDV